MQERLFDCGGRIVFGLLVFTILIRAGSIKEGKAADTVEFRKDPNGLFQLQYDQKMLRNADDRACELSCVTRVGWPRHGLARQGAIPDFAREFSDRPDCNGFAPRVKLLSQALSW